jgi:signal transduction histidine kinase
MNSLFTKLSVALLVIVALMGATFFMVDRANSRLYYEELTQKLNAPIAMYVTGQRQLIEKGIPDLDSLKDLAGHAMVINPTAEIYLLDAEGFILGHALPVETVLRDRIDLGPVRSLISGVNAGPIHGDDPRSLDMQKVFSASEIRSGDQLEGYLYVVLGGQTYEALANDIGSSYIGKASLVFALAIVFAATTVGLLVFRLLTRRLNRLNREVKRATESEFDREPELSLPDSGGDEIDQLGHSFLAMSKQIREQLEQLTENDRLRRELVANISHDLRTPLSAMQGYLETLIIKGGSLSNEDRDRYLKIARKHTVRLGILIGDLFELA